MQSIANEKQSVVFVVRHGLATLRLNGYGETILTAELLPQGLESVKNAASYLAEQNPTELWVSPVKRCQQTATIISDATHLTIRTEPLLTEYHDETWDAFYTRMTTLVTIIRQQPKQARLCLCTHGAVIAAVSHLLVDREFTEWDLFDFPTPAGVREIHSTALLQTAF